MRNLYEPWFPIEIASESLYCEAIYDDYEGLRLFLQGENEEGGYLQVTFDSDMAYRKLDEGDFLLSEGDLPTGQRSFFYIAKQSEFIDWFNKESCNTKSQLGIVEYLIVTGNDCISVLALSAPTLTWITKIA